jgi:endonuclease/exonuclease/phosphatase family metal-dependent hydrolase
VPPLFPPAELRLEPPPQTARDTLGRLSTALREVPAKKRADNLLIGTWNIKAFSRVNRKWETATGDSPLRNLQDMCAIADVVSRFDVVALVEVKRDLTALRLLLRILGPNWSFIVSDVTEGDAGNSERLAYVFDLRRVRPSGLAGEIVIPDAVLRDPAAVLREQFARTPYAVSFSAGDKGFTLVSLHIKWGTPAQRTPEIAAIAEWLRDRADDPDEFNRNMIALGDFNIDRRSDPNWEAFISRGLTPPAELLDAPRTVGERRGLNSFFDQIAWFTKGSREALTLKYRTAGTFDWTAHILQEVARNTTKEARISDHFPLWAEFGLAD